MKLKGRVALVTGAGRGIGRSIALSMASQGAAVAATARSSDELDEVTRTIQGGGGNALALPCDLTEAGAPARMAQQAKDRFGPIDVLVNNAGVGSSADPRPLVEFDDDFWQRTLALNLTAPYLLCKAVLPDMIARHRGRIIMTASVNGKIGSLHGAAYAASKHGVLGLMRTIAIEVAGDGVTVNALCPGPVRTKMNNRRVEYDAQRLGVSVDEVEASATPIGRRLEPDEIASLALYLAGDESACVTGQAFNIDGGVLMAG